MHTQDCRIRVCIRWESVKLESVESILNSTIERFELVALERPLFVFVLKPDDDAVFLNTSDPESVVRKWWDERCPVREVFGFFEERVLTGAERHTGDCSVDGLNIAGGDIGGAACCLVATQGDSTRARMSGAL